MSTTRAPIRAVALASLVGTTIEWYDFFLYGTAAALVFNRLFFPTFDPLMGTLAAFGTYAVGFVARPIGGIVIGHFGDKVGRKSMLVLTLLIMGVATFLIGLLPTYDMIGPWAAVLLLVLRIAQGFGVGGEWGGAVLMAVEHAPASQRGYYGAWPQMGVPAGLLISTAVFAYFASLPEAEFLSWGWRVPFLLSALLVVVGFFIRAKISETPSFAKVKSEAREEQQPILEVLKRYPREVVLAMGARFAENGSFYIYSAFVLTYGTQYVRMDRQTILNGILLASALQLVALPIYGALSDRVGRRPVYLFGAAMTILWAYPFFLLVDTGNTTYVWIALVVGFVVAHSPMYGPQGAFLSELFGTSVRYSGASLGAQLSAVVAGGMSPLIATWLLAESAAPRMALSIYLAVMGIVTLVAVFVASETRHYDIS